MTRILLVEDNEMNRDMLGRRLQRQGFTVCFAIDGPSGVKKAADEVPDLILMDVALGEMDGWEATRLIKANPETRQIPIIALTAHALASDREKAMEVGCDGYLAKPCEPRAVVAEVQRFLGKNNGA